jgi:tryptophan synthase alpha subunit
MYDGLTIKNGRLINDRPNGVTGIQEALNIKQTLKKAEKLEMYSEAVSLGIQKAKNVEQVKDMFFM